MSLLQLNSRKIHDEPNILDGLGDQQLFLGILGLEAALQVRQTGGTGRGLGGRDCTDADVGSACDG